MSLKEFLEQYGISQRQFANVLGVTRQAVGYWCARKRRPRPVTAQLIVAFTGGKVSLEDLYYDNAGGSDDRS